MDLKLKSRHVKWDSLKVGPDRVLEKHIAMGVEETSISRIADFDVCLVASIWGWRRGRVTFYNFNNWLLES